MQTKNRAWLFAAIGVVATAAIGCSSDDGKANANTTSMTGGGAGTGGSGSGTGGSNSGGAGGSGTTGTGGTGTGGTTGGGAGTGSGGATGGSGGTTGGSGGTTGGNAGTGSGGSAGTGGADAGRSGLTFDVTTGDIMLAPGEEKIMCVDKKLPTTAAIDMVKMTSDLTTGGHHLVFYKSAATAEATTPYVCSTFRDITTGTVPLFIAQKPHTELSFPDHVAYTMPAGQMVRVELHFLNATTAPISVSGTVHLTDAVAGTITDHANLMFYGNLNINVPANSMATVGPTFHKFKTANTKIFGLTGHQHQRGTGVTIDLASAVTGAGTQLYSNTDWAEPPLTMFNPPLAPTAGQGFRYTCTYNNPTSSPVTFGEGVNQEMCFLWAYYYPDAGFDIGFN